MNNSKPEPPKDHTMELIHALIMYEDDVALEILSQNEDVDVNVEGTRGYRPLHMAVQAGLENVVEVLLETKADVEVEAEDIRVVGHWESGGRTPLHLAADLGQADIAKLLLDYKADAEHQDYDGNTPHMLACLRHYRRAPNTAVIDLLNHQEYYSSEWAAERFVYSQQQAKLREQYRSTVDGLLLQHHILSKTFSAEECKDILTTVLQVTDATGWSSTRHTAYNTIDIPCSKVPAIDKKVKEMVRLRVFSQMAEKYDIDLKRLGFRDLFFAKYDAKGQSGLDLHRDGSVLSFNILLNSEDEFEGGGTYFEHTNTTVQIQQGDALIHSGQLRHGGTPILTGYRYILVGFINVRHDRNAFNDWLVSNHISLASQSASASSYSSSSSSSSPSSASSSSLSSSLLISPGQNLDASFVSVVSSHDLDASIASVNLDLSAHEINLDI